MESINCAFCTKILSISQRKAVIEFTEKKDRGKRYIKNCRSISLLNVDTESLPEFIKRQSSHLIETSKLICTANQLTSFYMVATLAFNELSYFQQIKSCSKLFPTHCLCKEQIHWRKGSSI